MTETSSAVTETSQAPPAPARVTRFRKRPVVVEGITWDGGNYDAVRAFAVAPDGAECFRWPAPGELELWNDQEDAWIPCPVGHVVMKGVLGELYPVSPAALAKTFDPADEGAGR